MHLVVVGTLKKPEADVAGIIAGLLGMVAFEARQKIAGGGPAVVANYADPEQAQKLAGELSRQGVPAFVLDTVAVRSQNRPRSVRRFLLQEQELRYESADGETGTIAYPSMLLLLVASCSSGPIRSTHTVTERKFSIGKTLLAGGVPMTSKVIREETTTSDLHDEALWLYSHTREPLRFNRADLNYSGLGEAKQISRELNFKLLKNELRSRAPQALYDERLLKRAIQTRLLGPALDPDTDLDLAVEILSRDLAGNKGKVTP